MGWDTDRFPKNPDPELICCICQGVLKDALVSPCEHVFCSNCLKDWLKQKPECPNCRFQMSERELKEVIPLVKNLISKLEIFCDYKERGCTEITTIEELQQHLRSCNFAPSEESLGCNLKFPGIQFSLNVLLLETFQLPCEFLIFLFFLSYYLASFYFAFLLRVSFNPSTTNVSYHIEISQLICNANQSTVFYMTGNTGR